MQHAKCHAMNVEACKQFVDTYCGELDLDRNLITDVRYGDMSAIFPDSDHLGATLVNEVGDRWMIYISELTPDDKLEEVVAHEVCHVLFQSEKENGEEVLVTIAAALMVKVKIAHDNAVQTDKV